MKKFVKAITAVGAVTPAVLAGASIAHAEAVNCGASFLPAGLCNTFAGASGFTLSGILSIVFAVVIAGLVLFILFQIVKAVFQWIGKSGDEKARSAAIKSITDAVIAGIVLIIALLIVVFGSKALGIGDVPNPLYACYTTGTSLSQDGTATNKRAPEIQGATVYEGGSSGSNATPEISGNADATATQQTKLYCKEDKTGRELTTKYVIGKKVAVQPT